jgi:transposase
MLRPATVARKVLPGQDTKSISPQTCEADAPPLIVEVTPTSATMADGDSVGELHAHLDEQQMLPDQHLMDLGYVDAEVLAESQSR